MPRVCRKCGEQVSLISYAFGAHRCGGKRHEKIFEMETPDDEEE